MTDKSRVVRCANTLAVSRVHKASDCDGRRDYLDKSSRVLWLVPARMS